MIFTNGNSHPRVTIFLTEQKLLLFPGYIVFLEYFFAKMKPRVILVVPTLAILVFVLLPVVPYSSPVHRIGRPACWRGLTSGSYVVFRCGATMDLTVTWVLVGNGTFTYSHEIEGPVFLCFSQHNWSGPTP